MKETAAGRAGLIQLDAVDGAVFDLDAFHVLTADVENAVYLRIKEGSGVVVRYGLDLALVEHECRFDQCPAVAGRAGPCNRCGIRKLAVNILHGMDRGAQRASVVVAVERIQKGTVLTDERSLRGRRSGINAEKTVALVRAKRCRLYLIAALTLQEEVIVLLRAKERFHTGHLEFQVDRL